MIIFCDVSIIDIKNQGKNFKWKRPTCSTCKSKTWGHGFVFRFFNGLAKAIYIKRWICPCCKKVFTCRPNYYWQRYQESVSNIFEYLLYRVKHQKWPPEVSRQRGGHWLSKLIKNAKINLLIKETMLDTIIFYKNKNLSFN